MANLTEGNKQILRETYLGDLNMSLVELANCSVETCGQEVSHNALKIISFNEGWGVLKRRQMLNKSGQPEDVADEADDLRQIIYERIMDPDVTHNPTELSQLIRTWETIKSASPRRRSGKSARQQQIEATMAGVELLYDLIEKRSKDADTTP